MGRVGLGPWAGGADWVVLNTLFSTRSYRNNKKSALKTKVRCVGDHFAHILANAALPAGEG